MKAVINQEKCPAFCVTCWNAWHDKLQPDCEGFEDVFDHGESFEVYINKKYCTGCGECVKACPVGAITMEGGR